MAQFVTNFFPSSRNLILLLNYRIQIPFHVFLHSNQAYMYILRVVFTSCWACQWRIQGETGHGPLHRSWQLSLAPLGGKRIMTVLWTWRNVRVLALLIDVAARDLAPSPKENWDIKTWKGRWLKKGHQKFWEIEIDEILWEMQKCFRKMPRKWSFKNVPLRFWSSGSASEACGL